MKTTTPTRTSACQCGGQVRKISQLGTVEWGRCRSCQVEQPVNAGALTA